MSPKLRLVEVSKSYGPVQALRPTSLEVEEGEFLTLLGPSGSGKSTLLQLLAGLVAVDSGQIWIDGALSTRTPPHKRGLGVVFQNYALFPHLTVADNIAFPLEMRRMERAEIDRRVREILEIVQLPQLGDRLPRELSGGQQQRVAFARCAVYAPPIILMDEPLGALDKQLRDQMQGEIRRLHRELGATIIFVTHDQEEAMSMSDRICLMRDGSIEQLAKPSELYFRPRTLFAADFIGRANFVRGDFLARHAVAPSAAAPADALVMLRPEHIRFVMPGTTADFQVEAVLEDHVMLGSHTRHTARTADGTVLVCLSESHEGEHRSRPGDKVILGWDSVRCVVMEGERG
ncbi:ABC transporter ATP-binding protein [Rhizobium puerariae]|uniref:ABC transporter ATP-binding protein n=1 Tax=Rhizobium puerariae TaxID=1585791 RepID=A0ABV6AF29_9HYPH